jgi:hypothetical protein
MDSAVIRFASWGRVSTEDRQDPESSRVWRCARARYRPQAGDRSAGCQVRAVRKEISSVAYATAEAVRTLGDGELAVKAEVYAKIGLTLTFCPRTHPVHAKLQIGTDCHDAHRIGADSSPAATLHTTLPPGRRKSNPRSLDRKYAATGKSFAPPATGRDTSLAVRLTTRADRPGEVTSAGLPWRRCGPPSRVRGIKSRLRSNGR